jgi:hypothetical protein
MTKSFLSIQPRIFESGNVFAQKLAAKESRISYKKVAGKKSATFFLDFLWKSRC